jgi:hypothetical protein
VAQWRIVGWYRRFGVTCHFNLQGLNHFQWQTNIWTIAAVKASNRTGPHWIFHRLFNGVVWTPAVTSYRMICESCETTHSAKYSYIDFLTQEEIFFKSFLVLCVYFPSYNLAKRRADLQRCGSCGWYRILWTSQRRVGYRWSPLHMKTNTKLHIFQCEQYEIRSCFACKNYKIIFFLYITKSGNIVYN